MNNLYFVSRGLFGFIVTAYNSVYLKVEPGDIFGVIDIIANFRKLDQNSSKDSDTSTEEDQEEDESEFSNFSRFFTV